MVWKRKIRDPKKGNLTNLEKEIIKYVIKQLPKKHGDLINDQLQFLKLIKRIEYNNDIITEMYPEKFNSIPKEILFGRQEEFRLAVVKFRINEEKYNSEIHLVLGQLFDIKIRPKPPKLKDNASIEFVDIKMENILDKNIYNTR